MSLCGRTNACRVRILHMALLQRDNERSVVWFLLSFNEAIATSPNASTMDASYTTNMAARKTFPGSKIILDAWNLDQIQMRHMSTYRKTRGCVHLGKDMSSDLSSLRNSSSAATLTRRRWELSMKYFGYDKPVERTDPVRNGEGVNDVDGPTEDIREDCVDQVDYTVIGEYETYTGRSAAVEEQRPDSSVHAGPGGEHPAIER